MSRSTIYVIALATFCTALVLSLPGVIITRNDAIEEELEKWLEIDAPSDFTIVKCGSCGAFFFRSRYAYTIQFGKESFQRFISHWSIKYGKRRSWTGSHGKILLKLSIQEKRTLFFDHGTLTTH